MKAVELGPEVTPYLRHIEGWQDLITDEVATILDKIARGQELSRSDLSKEATPSEVAAIWSVKYKTDINPRYVREVRRNGRIEPSREWGKGSTYRCLYKVRGVINIEVGHQRGRPR